MTTCFTASDLYPQLMNSGNCVISSKNGDIDIRTRYHCMQDSGFTANEKRRFFCDWSNDSTGESGFEANVYVFFSSSQDAPRGFKTLESALDFINK